MNTGAGSKAVFNFEFLVFSSESAREGGKEASFNQEILEIHTDINRAEKRLQLC